MSLDITARKNIVIFCKIKIFCFSHIKNVKNIKKYIKQFIFALIENR